jgi:hypothetical protein
MHTTPAAKQRLTNHAWSGAPLSRASGQGVNPIFPVSPAPSPLVPIRWANTLLRFSFYKAGKRLYEPKRLFCGSSIHQNNTVVSHAPMYSVSITPYIADVNAQFSISTICVDFHKYARLFSWIDTKTLCVLQIYRRYMDISHAPPAYLTYSKYVYYFTKASKSATMLSQFSPTVNST